MMSEAKSLYSCASDNPEAACLDVYDAVTAGGRNFLTPEPGPRRDVLDFIRNFSGARKTFTSGCCYWFAYILCTRFPEGETVLSVVENHFLARISGRLYDVTGDVTAAYGKSLLVPWDRMPEYDELQYRRLLRDCVYKNRQ